MPEPLTTPSNGERGAEAEWAGWRALGALYGRGAVRLARRFSRPAGSARLRGGGGAAEETWEKRELCRGRLCGVYLEATNFHEWTRKKNETPKTLC